MKHKDVVRTSKAFIEACKGKQTIEVEGNLRIEAGDDWLMYRKGERSKTMHTYEVDPRIMKVVSDLQERVRRIVDVKRWTGSGPCGAL